MASMAERPHLHQIDTSAFYTPPRRPTINPLQRSNKPPHIHVSPTYHASTAVSATSPPTSPPSPSYKTHHFSPTAFSRRYQCIDGMNGDLPSPALSDSSMSSILDSPALVTPTRIVLGGIVSPRLSDEEWDEKSCLSIEVPGIVLTEPCNATPTRTPSPPPKTIMLLPPTSLNLPTDSTGTPIMNSYTPSSYTPPARLYSPAFAALVYGDNTRRRSCFSASANGARAVLLLMILIIGAWHLWLGWEDDVGIWREKM